ncbi:hypothetical protein SALBM217S_08672 [Streptomyces griseoloalbus]
MTTDTSTQLDGAAVADKDGEASVLGACMLATPAYDPIADAARIIEPGDLGSTPAHETVWTAITRLHGQSQPTGLPMVVAELTKSGDLARIGGRIALSQMVDAACTSGEVEQYATDPRLRQGARTAGRARARPADGPQQRTGHRRRHRARRETQSTTPPPAARPTSTSSRLGTTFTSTCVSWRPRPRPPPSRA